MSSSRSALACAFAALVLGAACSKTKPADKSAAGGSGSGPAVADPAGPPDPWSQAIVVKSKELRDHACACTDAACATAVRKDHDAWLHTQIDEVTRLGHEPPSTKAQQEEAAKWQRELFACLDKLQPAAGSGAATGTGAAAGNGAATGTGAAAGNGAAAPASP